MLWYFNEIFDGLNRVSLLAARRDPYRRLAELLLSYTPCSSPPTVTLSSGTAPNSSTACSRMSVHSRP